MDPMFLQASRWINFPDLPFRNHEGNTDFDLSNKEAPGCREWKTKLQRVQVLAIREIWKLIEIHQFVGTFMRFRGGISRF